MSNFENLEKMGQSQLLRFYDELTDTEKENLKNQINRVDFTYIDMLKAPEEASEMGEISPLGAMTIPEIEKRRDEFEKVGIEAIRQGKVAALLLGGGAGTRLGFSGPKGTYNVGITREFYIYQAQFETMLSVCEKAGAYFPLLIMTSESNDADTRAFLKEHSYFGFPEDKIFFFVQSMAPTCDFDGKVYLEGKDKVSMSPNGNGGFFKDIIKCGLDKKLREMGVEWLNIFAIDNVLQKICDPAFIGATLISGVNCGAKVVSKAAPKEKIGALCLVDNKPTIVEYFELSDELAEMRDEDGNILYRFGVILNYLYRIDKLYQVVNEKMPLHKNRKKIPYIDEKGTFIKPETENGFKFEYLATDLVREMETCLPYEVVREKEFAPIKNKEGIDSVESARELLRLNGVEL